MSAAVMDDEQIIRGIVEWARQEKKVPGQNRVMEKYSIGKSRVARLLAVADQRIAEERDRTGPDQPGADAEVRETPVRGFGMDRTEQTGPSSEGKPDTDRSSNQSGPGQTGPAADVGGEAGPRPVRSSGKTTKRVATGPDRSTEGGGPAALVQSAQGHSQAGLPDTPFRSEVTPGPVRLSWRSGLVWAVAAAVLGLLGYRLVDTAIGRGILGWLAALGPHRLIAIGGVSAAAAVAATAVAVGRRQIRKGGRWSTRVFLAGACIGVVVSGDTSWRFFQTRAHIDSVWERLAIFSGVEVVLVACGIAMYERAKEGHSPGNARWLAWALSGVSGYAALMLDGFPAGPFRVAAGPVLAVVALHMAMGIEIRHSGARRRGEVWGKVLGELRERCLSRLGLGDDSRDARTRTRHRAAVRAARLAARERVPFKAVRLRRALVKAGVADDQEMRWVVERTLAVLKHADALEDQRWESPWTPVITDERGGSMAMAMAIVEAVGSCGRTKRTLRKESTGEGHEG